MEEYYRVKVWPDSDDVYTLHVVLFDVEVYVVFIRLIIQSLLIILSCSCKTVIQ